MPVPNLISDLSETASSNSPQGSETVGTQANDYLQALGAFIRQIWDGNIKPLIPVDFNTQRITNVGAGSTGSASTDLLTGAQIRGLSYKVGELRMWSGAVANIPTVWGTGWQLADGSNGTPDLRDRFMVAAGGNYSPGSTGGVTTNFLSITQLPPHNHGISDPGHIHTLSDGGHTHSLNDPGHAHGGTLGGFVEAIPGTSNTVVNGNGNFATAPTTAANTTGMSVNGSGANISMQYAGTGISTTNTGSNAGIENRPLFYAVCILVYTGIGA